MLLTFAESHIKKLLKTTTHRSYVQCKIFEIKMFKEKNGLIPHFYVNWIIFTFENCDLKIPNSHIL